MSARPPLAIVVAIGRNGAIGRGNQLPWTMPGDLARFRDLTMGTPMIMGRRTFESIGRALPGRESIVVSRDPPPLRYASQGRIYPTGTRADLPPGVHHVPDPDAALALATTRAAAMGAATISLIGGASLFETMMPLVDRLHVTFVDLSPDADTFFPAIDPAIWHEVSRTVPPRHPKDEATCVFVDYRRS